MELLISLLEFSKKHSQAIIVVLLGTLAAGGIAGGMWIHDLQDIVTSKDAALEQARKIGEERETVAKQQLAAATANADVSLHESTAKFRELSANSHKLKEYVIRVDQVVSVHLARDRTLAIGMLAAGKEKGTPSESSMSTERASAALIASVDDTRSELSKVEDWVKWIDDRSSDLGSEMEPTIAYSQAPKPVSQAPTSRISYFVLLSIVVSALCFGIVLIRYQRRRPSNTPANP